MRQRTWNRSLLGPALAALIGLSTPVAAQDDTDEDLYRKPGVFLTAMAVYGIPAPQRQLEHDIERKFDTRGADVEGSFGLDLRAGYRLNPRLALEGQFEWLRRLQVESRPSGGGEKRTEDIRVSTFTGNAKGYVLTGRIQPYGVLGAGWMFSELKSDGPGSSDHDDGFLIRFGGGADFYASEDIALTLEASYVLAPGGGVNDLDHVSLSAGLTLRFYALDD
jgi:opacity protein-like surface antigen